MLTTEPVRDDEVWASLPETSHFLRPYLQYSKDYCDSPLVYAAGAAYALLSAVVPSVPADPPAKDESFELRGVAGGAVHANLWVLLVGYSGDRKSTATSLANKLLTAASPALVSSVPGSTEALEASLNDRPKQLIFMGEMGSFIADTRDSGSYLAKMKPKLTELYDGEGFNRQYMSRSGAVCHAPRISILAGCTPEYLKGLSRADWQGGFQSRFLTLYSEREGRAFDDMGTDAARAALVDFLVKSSGCDKAPAGPCLGMTEAAKRRYREWATAFEAKWWHARDKLSGQITRTQSGVLKMALLNAWDQGAPYMSEGGGWYIGIEHIEPAILFMEVLAWRSVAHVAAIASNNKDVQDRRAILAVTSEKTWLTMGELGRRAPEVGTNRRIKEVIQTLCSEGALQVMLASGQTYYRRPDAEERLLFDAANQLSPTGQPDQTAPPLPKEVPPNPVSVSTGVAVQPRSPWPDEDDTQSWVPDHGEPPESAEDWH